jgi:hypothetical protein
MLSLTRRQLLIGGLASSLAPTLGFACSAASPEKLVLSGRVVGTDGKPLAGAVLPVGRESIVTDADGRFVLVTDTGVYRGPDLRRDAEGTWRATLGIALG